MGELDCRMEEMEEGERLLDFERLCSKVALQSHDKWRVLENEQAGNGGSERFGGAFRMWEGDLLDFLDHRRIALHTLCCPCYRFGKNMKRAGLGSTFLQGAAYLMFILLVAFNYIAFIVTKRHCFLYLALALTVAVGVYSGFLRTQMRKKFNIKGNNNSLYDCMYHLACPFCSMSQEARTLEMNNVQDGTWHGRGDTICVGSLNAGSRAFFESHPPAPMLVRSTDASSVQKMTDVTGPSLLR